MTPRALLRLKTAFGEHNIGVGDRRDVSGRLYASLGIGLFLRVNN